MHQPGQTGPDRRDGQRDAAAHRIERASSWRIPLLYLILGVVWIVFSDRALGMLIDDPAILTRVQTFKGAFYVLATAALLHLLLKPMIGRLLSSQQRLLESENRYRELFEGNPSPMLVYDLETLRIVDANAEASAFLGWPRGELLGMEAAMLWPPEDVGIFQGHVEAVRRAPGQTYRWLERLRTSDGSTRDVEMRSSDLARGDGPHRLVVLADRTAELRAQRAREQITARLQEAQRIASLGSWELDLRTRRGRFCEIFQSLLGHAAHDERSQPLQEMLVAADSVSQQRLDQLLDDLGAGLLQRIDVLLPFIDLRGNERLLRLRAQLQAGDGNLPVLRGTAQDVTEEQQTRRLLDEREQQFKELMRILPDGVMIVSEGRIFYANPACGAMFGRRPEALLGDALADLVEPASQPALQRALAGDGIEQDASPWMRREDDSRFRAALSVSDARYGGQDCKLLVVRDLTEPERMRDALAAGNRELQAMAQRLFSAQEDERRAISRELHDDVGQAITAIKLAAHAALSEDDAALRAADLADIAATADTTLEKLRNLSMLLRPPQLDALGLEAALRWHAGVVFRSVEVELDLAIERLDARPDRVIEQACFRIAQEALTNVLRHAGATRVRLALREDGHDGLELSVSDDGRGFDPAAARGLGLAIMRERALGAGGGLQIETGPQAGTRLLVRLPHRAPALDGKGAPA